MAATIKVKVRGKRKYRCMTVQEIMNHYGLVSYAAVKSRLRRAGDPTIVDDDSIFRDKSPPKILVDGEPISLTKAMQNHKLGCKALKEEIAKHGDKLTSEHLKLRASVKWGKKVSAKKEKHVVTTPEEREKLARIKDPSPFELRLFPDTGKEGFVKQSSSSSGFHVLNTIRE